MKNKFILLFCLVFMLAGCGVRLCLSTPKTIELKVDSVEIEKLNNGVEVTVADKMLVIEKSEYGDVSIDAKVVQKEEILDARTLDERSLITTVFGPEAAVAGIPLEPKKEASKVSVRKSFIGEDSRQLHPFMANKIVSSDSIENPVKWAKEEMEFSVNYSFVRAGTAYIKTKGVMDTALGKAYVVETTAKSASVIDAVFKVRDINYSFISLKDFSSFGYSQSLREGNYIRDEWLTFDVNKKTYSGVMRKKDGQDRMIDGVIPGPVQDMLSSLFFMRQQDLSGNKDIILDVTNREVTYPMVVKILKRETIKTGAGKFKCVVVEPMFRGEGIFIQKGKSLKVWLTDDEYKMPVKMETKVFIGSVNAELESYKRG